MKRMKLPATSSGESPSQTSSLLGNEQQGIKPPFGMNLSATSNGEAPSQTSSLLGGKQQIIRSPFGRNLPATSSGGPTSRASSLLGNEQQKGGMSGFKSTSEVNTAEMHVIETNKTNIISPYQENLYGIDQVNTAEIPTIAV